DELREQHDDEEARDRGQDDQSATFTRSHQFTCALVEVVFPLEFPLAGGVEPVPLEVPGCAVLPGGAAGAAIVNMRPVSVTDSAGAPVGDAVPLPVPASAPA